MPVGRDGGGTAGGKIAASLSRVQGAWPFFVASTDQITYQIRNPFK